MGQEVLAAVCCDPELSAVAAVEKAAEQDYLPLPDGSADIPLSTHLEASIEAAQPDVLVDFTIRDATMQAVRVAVPHGMRLVVGTTGLTAADLEEIDGLCRRHGVGAVIAPNFALGAVVMMHLARIAAKYFDWAEIIEMHHERKVDAPSGTSLSTARQMVEARGRGFCTATTEKETLAGSRGADYQGIALHSVRLPGFLAHQEVILGTAGQTLKIRHDQISRQAFMPGVILAIKKVMELREPVFGLDKLLGL